MKETCDVLVIGSGVAGLICALSLPKNSKVCLITKKKLQDSNSYLAQGGICVCKNKEDRASFIEDTLKAGEYKNTLKSVEIMVDESQSAIKTLINYGVSFTKKDGEFIYTKEGAHSTNRILYCEDQTGKFIMEALIKEIKSRNNIKIFEDCTCKDLYTKDDKCFGAYAYYKNSEIYFSSKYTVLATGGIGGLYENTTNYRHIKGDGIAFAIKHNIKLKDISYIQIHPTAFYETKKERKFLISESVRGEGAILLNSEHKRFTNELNPRNIVSKAILKEMKKEKANNEWLDFRNIPLNINIRFPNICKYLRERNIDPEKELVPIVPAQHYTMGGIMVDSNSKTSLDRLYAVGEVSCTGVHGKNRLASNSLLESVVYGKRAAKSISNNLTKKDIEIELKDIENLSTINDKDAKLWIFKAIEEEEKIYDKQI